MVVARDDALEGGTSASCPVPNWFTWRRRCRRGKDGWTFENVFAVAAAVAQMERQRDQGRKGTLAFFRSRISSQPASIRSNNVWKLLHRKIVVLVTLGTMYK